MPIGATQQELATQQSRIAQEEAVIKADQAAIEYAKTQLSYTKLLSPFDGVAGIRLLDVGSDHKVAMRPVSVRETLNGEALIDKGLTTGETVVMRGQYRLTQGAIVSLANSNNPDAVPNPTPASAGLLP